MENPIEKSVKNVTNLVVKVNDKISAENAGTALKDIKEVRSKVVAYWAEPKKTAYDTWKQICAKESAMLEPLDRTEKQIRAELNNYLSAEEAKRRAEQAKIEEEARLKAEKERQKLEKQAEKAESKGQAEKAEDLRTAAENVYAEPVFVKEAEKLTGVSVKKDIEIVITDRKALISFAVDNLPEAIINIDTVKLKRYISQMKIKSMPGVAIKEVAGAIIRG